MQSAIRAHVARNQQAPMRLSSNVISAGSCATGSAAMTNAHPRRYLWLGASALAAALLALAGGRVAVAVLDVDALSAGAWRLALATPIVWTAAVLWGPRRLPEMKLHCGLVLAAATAFAGVLGLSNVAVRSASVADAAVLFALSPFFMAVYVRLFLGRRSSSQVFAGALLAFAGALAMIAGTDLDWGELRGSAAGVGSAILYAAYVLLFLRLGLRASVLWAMSAVCPIAAVALFAAALAAGEQIWPSSALDWTLLIGLAAVTQVLGQGLLMAGLARLRPDRASLVLILDPLLATALAAVLIGQWPGPLTAAGATLVLLGLVLGSLPWRLRGWRAAPVRAQEQPAEPV